MTKKLKTRTSKRASNMDLVVAAVFQLEGRTQVVDTEDVAVVVEKIAPGRFSWKKYKDRTDLELVRSNLKHATENGNGALLTGSKSTGWVLTEAGRQRARILAETIGRSDLTGVVQTDEEKRLEKWLNRERERMVSTGLVETFERDGLESISIHEIEAFFQVDEYITGDSRARKVDRLVSAFRNDPTLGNIIQIIAPLVMEIK